MPHQRQQIRAAVAAALVAGSTSAGSRVFTTRKIPIRNVELPALAVYGLSESIDKSSVNTAPKELSRNLSLMIEGLVMLNDNVDNTLDALAVQVERVMDADETFGGVCGWSILESVEMDVFEEGNKELGLLRMVYQVRYYTYAPDAADVTLNDLDTVHVTTVPTTGDGTVDPNVPVLQDSVINLEI